MIDCRQVRVVAGLRYEESLLQEQALHSCMFVAKMRVRGLGKDSVVLHSFWCTVVLSVVVVSRGLVSHKLETLRGLNAYALAGAPYLCFAFGDSLLGVRLVAGYRLQHKVGDLRSIWTRGVRRPWKHELFGAQRKSFG